MIVKSVTLALSPEAAFALFTEQASQWWPADRRHTGDPASVLAFTADGRFVERGKDGAEVLLARITAWEPPQRIVLDFYVATGPEHPTEAEIVFTPDGSGTRVTVTHRPKPESESLWNERALRYERSWLAVLDALAATSDHG